MSLLLVIMLKSMFNRLREFMQVVEEENMELKGLKDKMELVLIIFLVQ